MSVIIPPRIDANESGMSVSAGLRLALWAACRSTGMRSASAATLFMTAESTAAIPDMIPMCPLILRLLLTAYRAMSSITPEFDRPRLMIRTRAITTVAGCPKPENACSMGTTSVMIATSSATNATTS